MNQSSKSWIGVLALTLMSASPLALAAGSVNNPAFDSQEKVDGRAVNEPGDFNAWAHHWSTEHHGRISRQAYMNEMSRRWDAMDRSGQGLTPREVSELTGRVDSNVPPALTGSGVQPANMGPGNSRGN